VSNEDLLPADRAARLERLSVHTHHPVAGALAGQHSSPRRGSSLDFADHRAYTVGDDFRRIDQNLLARLDHLVIKLFDSEDDLTVNILIDDSASMSVGGKLEQAKQLAAAIGFVTLRRRDTVIVHSLTGAPRRCSGITGMPTLFATLRELAPTGETNLVAAVDRFLSARGNGLTLLISDFLTPEWDTALRGMTTQRRTQAVAIHVLHPEELDPPLTGDLELVDIETGALLNVSLDESALKKIREHTNLWLSEVAKSCQRLGFDHSILLATDDLDTHLDRQWRSMDLLR
jgi:uncharacterized protein (DUF58 family)